MASIPCSLCKRYVVNLKEERFETYKCGPNKEERVCERPKGTLPPCDSGGSCPKGHWSRESECVLSPRNVRTFELYRQVRATSGACLTEEMREDELLMANLSEVQKVFEAWERRRLSEELAYQVALLYKR